MENSTNTTYFDTKLHDLKWSYVKTDVELIMPLIIRMLTESVEIVRTAWKEDFTTDEKT